MNKKMTLRNRVYESAIKYISFFTMPNLIDSKTKHLIFWMIFSLPGLIISNRGLPPLILMVKVEALIASIAMFVYLLNDAMDADMDSYNPIKSNRPIPAGIATRNHALHLSLIGGIIGVSIAFTMNVPVLISSLAFMILGFMYSLPPFNLKKRFLMKESTLIMGFFFVNAIGWFATGLIRPSFYYINVYWALFIFTIVPTFYDALDVEEDERVGCKTVAILFNQKRRLELTIAGLIVMIATSPLSYLYLGFNLLFPIMICGVCLLFLRFVYPLLLEPEKVDTKQIVKGSRYIQLFILVVMLSFLIGSFKIL